MSDSIEELTKHYRDDVLNAEHPRSIGLFPIPEYPEYEEGQGMWSTALETILTTLRYLAPATLLTLFWGQQSFLFRILKHIDSALRAIIFSSDEQKQDVLQWLAEAGPVKVEHLNTVWCQGWILCAVLDAALPGACAGHAPSRLSLKHAQTIADHYLGVEPVFSRQELESNGSLSKHQEWRLATYLDRIRHALSKLPPPVSKPASQRTSPVNAQFTLDYMARGSGLTAAQLNNKVYFKVYPTTQQSIDPGEITILIKGPRDTYGMSVLPPILGKAQMIRQRLLGLPTKPNYTENALPITQGATYMRSYGKTDMQKTYFIPKSKYDIDIEFDIRPEHAKIGYTVKMEGKYEISITSRGEHVIGSPFIMTATNNIISIFERDSFSLEDGEEIDIVDVKTDRKVVLRIVDFVTEKMLLRDNGTLEKISENDAKLLMTMDKIDSTIHTHLNFDESKNNLKPNKFKNVANKVKMMIRVSKIFFDILIKENKILQTKSKEVYNRPVSQQGIPDIVNSTFNETHLNPYKTNNREKVIVPENLSVSLRTETLTSHVERIKHAIETKIQDISNTKVNTCPKRTHSKNPFLNIQDQDNIYNSDKKFEPFLSTEYETNNSQNEETQNTPVKIFVEENDSPSPIIITNNPFIDPDIINMERPKTPVLKIITGETKNRSESVYIDPKVEFINEQILGNEFINPFFIHQHHQSSQFDENYPAADFIIGAPVSLPPLVKVPSPEPEMESLIVTTENQQSNDSQEIDPSIDSLDDISSSVFSTPLHHLTKKEIKKTHNRSPTFHSMDSDNIEIVDMESETDTFHRVEFETVRDVTPKKDLWDSAYVSIDDSNSSPDSNNNDNVSITETVSKQKFSPSDNTGLKYEEICKMGPAEREIWQTCSDLSEDALKTLVDDTIKSNKWEPKRQFFTPIIEESDNSIAAGGLKENAECLIKLEEADPVTEAFAELNDVFHQYSNSEQSSITTNEENRGLQNVEVEYIFEEKNVNSASELVADVKRHTLHLEGKISEVQPNVTESGSVSQPLPAKEDSIMCPNTDIKFGTQSPNSIVIEKKKYWDEKIKEIEAHSEETKFIHKRKKLSSKHLRLNDSLSKKRGKQMIKHFLNTDDNCQIVKQTGLCKEKVSHDVRQSPTEELPADGNLVEKWKRYWDNKLEVSKDETDDTSIRAKSPKISQKQCLQSNSNTINIDSSQKTDKMTNKKWSSLPAKQELPEEVFKAFETSPKRFFGTSRKQILNKIDTFLGKPSTADESSIDERGAQPDSGLVSSRISLFHSISRTEQLPQMHRKCYSMQNIYQRKESVKSNDSPISSDESKTFNSDKETSRSISTSSSDVSSPILEIDHTNHRDKQTSNRALKQKRFTMFENNFNQSFDESNMNIEAAKEPSLRHKLTQENLARKSLESQKRNNGLQDKSKSKSEMDIFSKITKQPPSVDLDIHKSYEELPKINVKSFISLYESVSKASIDNSFPRNRLDSTDSQKNLRSNNLSLDAALIDVPIATNSCKKEYETSRTRTISDKSLSPNGNSESGIEEKEYLSLSEIDLEIVDNSGGNTSESSPEREIKCDADYKSRFKMAKDFFKSLESLDDLKEIKKTPKLNECELLLKQTTESPQTAPRPPKRVKKNIKSHSLPSSEITKVFNQLQQSQEEKNSPKLVKISEKFNVDDLFNDVIEGRLSRQGSLRGIPHKKAVLETFRSMENITDRKMSPYENAVSQLNDFAKENKIKNAQTYLSEYPYLPTTDPSKYHSRLDTNAFGLISLKDVLNNRKPRRNSVPDLRLNSKFTVDL